VESELDDPAFVPLVAAPEPPMEPRVSESDGGRLSAQQTFSHAVRRPLYFLLYRAK